MALHTGRRDMVLRCFDHDVMGPSPRSWPDVEALWGAAGGLTWVERDPRNPTPRTLFQTSTFPNEIAQQMTEISPKKEVNRPQWMKLMSFFLGPCHLICSSISYLETPRFVRSDLLKRFTWGTKMAALAGQSRMGGEVRWSKRLDFGSSFFTWLPFIKLGPSHNLSFMVTVIVLQIMWKRQCLKEWILKWCCKRTFVHMGLSGERVQRGIHDCWENKSLVSRKINRAY